MFLLLVAACQGFPVRTLSMIPGAAAALANGGFSSKREQVCAETRRRVNGEKGTEVGTPPEYWAFG